MPEVEFKAMIPWIVTQRTLCPLLQTRQLLVLLLYRASLQVPCLVVDLDSQNLARLLVVAVLNCS